MKKEQQRIIKWWLKTIESLMNNNYRNIATVYSRTRLKRVEKRITKNRSMTTIPK